MARARRRRSMPNSHRFERTDRVAQLVRNVVASEMECLDEAFGGVVVTGVDVDREFMAAVVHYDLRDADQADAVAASFSEHQHRFQRMLGDQASMRRTPALRFRRDMSIVAADRIEQLLAGLSAEQGEVQVAGLSAEQSQAQVAGSSGEHEPDER